MGVWRTWIQDLKTETLEDFYSTLQMLVITFLQMHGRILTYLLVLQKKVLVMGRVE